MRPRQQQNLATHPLCAQPTDEEIAWVESALKTAENMRKEAEALTQKEAPIGSANRFSAEDFAQEWLQEGEGEQNKDVGDATNEDWVPTFHSAQSGEIVEVESIAEEEHEHVSIIRDAVSLKAITFLFAGNAKLIFSC